MSHHIVEAKSVSYRYSKDEMVLNDISFRITHGESVAIVGPNGAGKSTLLLHLNGCLLPCSGEVHIGHLPVRNKTLPTIRQTVGLVFQNPDDQLFMPTVKEDVGFGPVNLGLEGEELEKVIQKAMKQTGTLHLQNRPPFSLSGGEKKAVAIATVLSMEPSVLVLDEPSSQLDPKSVRELAELLQKFKHTKMIATHDLEFAKKVCNRVIILNNGSVAEDGSIELLNDVEILKKNDLW